MPGLAQERNACVVVEKGKIRTPPKQDGRAGREAETDEATKILRPRLRLSEVRPGPVESSHATRELAVPRKDRLPLQRGRIVAVHDGAPPIGPTSSLGAGGCNYLAKLPERPAAGLLCTAGSHELLAQARSRTVEQAPGVPFRLSKAVGQLITA